MDWDTLRASADLVLGASGPEVRMLFIGGEPLLEFPLIRRAVEYIEARRPGRLAVHYDIITNGTLLREEQADFLVRHDFEVQLSFDGVPSAQDLRGRGTFAVLDRLLDRLREEHPDFYGQRLTVALTLLPSTVPCLADSIDYFLGKGVGRMVVAPAITHQPGWRPESMAELDGQFARVFRASLRHYRRTGQVPLTLFLKQRESSPRPQPSVMCAAGRAEKAAVDVDGQVHGCLMFVDSYQKFPTAFLRTRLEAMRMGGLRDAGLPQRLAAYPDAARAAGIFHNKQDKYSSYGRCRECRFVSECGICPVAIGHEPGNTDPDRIPDFQCAYNLVSLKYRERFPFSPSARERIVEGPVPEKLRALLAFAEPRKTARRRPRRREARA
jgi:sulfatase maturation enzyme AslB (radical SAM superfamily)